MALVRGQVNPLNVLGLRRLDFIPENFAKISSKNIENVDTIDQWIYHRLDSRYCIKKSHLHAPNYNTKTNISHTTSR